MAFVLGVDLDGVCANFIGRMREIAAELKNVEPEKLTNLVTHGLKEWELDYEYNDLHRFAVTQRELFKTMEPIKGAVPALRRLDNDGVHIRIITHRLYIPYFHQEAVSQTTWWLDYHGFPYHDLCFMKEKSLVDANLYIEDSPDNIRDLLNAKKKVIVFSNSTNADLTPEPEHRADCWADVEEIMASKFPEYKSRAPRSG
jgi:5'(3')-deoxyribonucleotidase